jgi:hypothetical protein
VLNAYKNPERAVHPAAWPSSQCPTGPIPMSTTGVRHRAPHLVARGEPIRSQPSQKTRRAPPLADHASVVSNAAADPSVTPIATASHSRRDPFLHPIDATPPSAIPVGTMFEAGGERDSPNRQALRKGHRSCQVSQRSTPVHTVAPADARPDGNALIRQKSARTATPVHAHASTAAKYSNSATTRHVQDCPDEDRRAPTSPRSR